MLCERCRLEFSNSWSRCPRCGHPARPSLAGRWPLLVLGIALIGAGVATWTWQHSHDPPSAHASLLPPSPPARPAVTPPPPEVPVVIAPTVVVLDDVTAATATVTPNSVSIPIPAATRYPGLVPGAIIASGYGSGFLRRVTASGVESVGLFPQLRMTTIPAAITDAVAEGSFRWSRPLVAVHETFDGVRIVGDDNVNVSVARGHLHFTPVLTITGLIQNHALQRLELAVEGPLDAELLLGITARTRASLDREVSLLRVPTPPMVFAIGPLPVVVSASVSLDAHALAEVDANVGVEGGFTANHALSVGMLYENGSTQVTGDRDLGLRSVGPQGQCGGNAGATVSLRERVEVTFYELAGPYLTLEPYLRLSNT